MTDLMQMIYTYILESRVPEYIDKAKHNLELCRADQLWKQLSNALPESEQQTLQNFQDTIDNLNDIESEAIFKAAWTTARELS